MVMNKETQLSSASPWDPTVGLALGPYGTEVPLQRYMYRGTSPIRKRPPSQDPPRTLGIGIRQGPKGLRFLVSEVPLHFLVGEVPL